jgi:hypothetical protein
MHIWSQIARLGAFVAAFGPPVLAEAENEPEKAALPTVGVTDQPVAEVVDVDAQRTHDELANINVPDGFAAIPVAVQPPLVPNDSATKRLGRRTAAPTKPDPIQRRTSRGWHGAGQRYG